MFITSTTREKSKLLICDQTYTSTIRGNSESLICIRITQRAFKKWAHVKRLMKSARQSPVWPTIKNNTSDALTENAVSTENILRSCFSPEHNLQTFVRKTHINHSASTLGICGPVGTISSNEYTEQQNSTQASEDTQITALSHWSEPWSECPSHYPKSPVVIQYYKCIFLRWITYWLTYARPTMLPVSLQSASSLRLGTQKRIFTSLLSISYFTSRYLK